MSYTYDELKSFVRRVKPYILSVVVYKNNAPSLLDVRLRLQMYVDSTEIEEAILVEAPKPYNLHPFAHIIEWEIPFPLSGISAEMCDTFVPGGEDAFVQFVVNAVKKDFGVG